ncbi:MAG TPA: hypothetical protein VF941_13495 [Clostridia bacterium]
MLERKSRYHANKKNIFSRPTTYIIIVILLLFISPIIFGVVYDNWPKNYYLKDLKVCNAVIVEKNNEDGKNYIRLSVNSNDLGNYPNPNDLWIEVQNTFYVSHTLNSTVGALISENDVYKRRFFSSGQDFEKTYYEVQEIYDSLDAAQQANPSKKYTDKALLVKKKTTKNGDTYFNVKKDDRTFTLNVSREIYDRYNLNDEIECDFESVGDLTKLLKIAGTQ